MPPFNQGPNNPENIGNINLNERERKILVSTLLEKGRKLLHGRSNITREIINQVVDEITAQRKIKETFLPLVASTVRGMFRANLVTEFLETEEPKTKILRPAPVSSQAINNNPQKSTSRSKPKPTAISSLVAWELTKDKVEDERSGIDNPFPQNLPFKKDVPSEPKVESGEKAKDNKDSDGNTSQPSLF
jgi:hypothetical protein